MEYLNKIHSSWTCFNNLKNSDKIFKNLYKKNILEPKIEYLFEPFNIDVRNIKLVIIGQDPYPNGEGIGYAFAYNDFYPKPKSFSNIEKVLGHSLSPTLEEWKEKGIMSVNAAMTVIKHKPLSQFIMWEKFTNTWIKFLDSKNNNIQFLFLGAKSRTYASNVIFNNVFTAPHPAARYGQFLKTDIFNKINLKL